MPLAKDRGFDAAVFDREDHPVAVIQVKAHPLGKQWTSLLRTEKERITKAFPDAAFLLAIDPQYILVYGLSGKEMCDPVVRLDTPQVLSHYDPEFAGERHFEQYLVTLVEAWLRDLAYHWKSAKPPGSDELAAVGFLGRVEGGTTHPSGA